VCEEKGKRKGLRRRGCAGVEGEKKGGVFWGGGGGN